MPGVANVFTRNLIVWRCCLMALWLLPVSAWSAASDLHAPWSQLLAEHVIMQEGGHATRVDYAGFQQDQAQLSAYLSSLAAIPPERYHNWSADNQLAFLINAYNAYTVALILTEYPDLSSIKDLGGFFSSPWDKRFAPLLGKTRSLDDIEHNMIRGTFDEPRIHFAVNCASMGCPALREEAYTGAALSAQLAEQTRRFLSDRQRNRLSGSALSVSPLFSWYRDDFTSGWRGLHSLPAFFAHYSQSLGLSDAERQALLAGDIDISFADYDWALNDLR